MAPGAQKPTRSPTKTYHYQLPGVHNQGDGTEKILEKGGIAGAEETHIPCGRAGESSLETLFHEQRVAVRDGQLQVEHDELKKTLRKLEKQQQKDEDQGLTNQIEELKN